MQVLARRRRWMAFSGLKPTPMIRLQPSETMDSTFGLKSASELDSGRWIWIPRLDWGTFEAVIGDSLNDLSSQPPGVRDRAGLERAGVLRPRGPAGGGSSAATAAGQGEGCDSRRGELVRCFMSVFPLRDSS